MQAGGAATAEGARLLVRALWALAPPEPVDASHPLFILYTSGSTGKPKGIVHVHGGYEVGLGLTARAVFDLNPRRDVLLVVATPGWIAGQSYMIAAALLTRTPSVLLEGSPVSPPDRFAAVIARHRVTVLKAGSTFLRMLMTTPDVDGGLLIPSGGPVGRGAVVGHCDGAPTALGEAGVEPLRVRDVGAPGGPHDV